MTINGRGVGLARTARTSTTPHPGSGERKPLLLCTRCQGLLPVAAFRPDPTRRRGYGSWCRACTVARTRQWRAEHRDAVNAATRARYRRDRAAILARKAAQYRSKATPRGVRASRERVEPHDPFHPGIHTYGDSAMTRTRAHIPTAGAGR
jgi:hypothetical protein